MEKRNDMSRVKLEVARLAAERVESGMTVGLGTGSTSELVIAFLGQRVREGKLHSIRGVPTSFQAGLQAREQGIPVVSLDDVEQIHLAIDGADEVDPHKSLIKGGGAAHTREKVVDCFADRFLVVVDSSKLVPRLGVSFPVPVEVLPFAFRTVVKQVRAMGGSPALRMGVKKVGPVITDEGNFVIDVSFPHINDAAKLERDLNSIPGVVENGLFVNVASEVLVGELQGGKVVVRSLV